MWLSQPVRDHVSQKCVHEVSRCIGSSPKYCSHQWESSMHSRTARAVPWVALYKRLTEDRRSHADRRTSGSVEHRKQTAKPSKRARSGAGGEDPSPPEGTPPSSRISSHSCTSASSRSIAARSACAHTNNLHLLLQNPLNPRNLKTRASQMEPEAHTMTVLECAFQVFWSLRLSLNAARPFPPTWRHFACASLSLSAPL